MEAVVEEGLSPVGDSENVLSFTGCDVQSGDGCDEEERKHHSQLTPNHKSGKVLAVSFEQEIASLLAEERSSPLFRRKFGNREESNLHSLEHPNNGHEEKEKEDRDSIGHVGVFDGHHGLPVEQGRKGDGQAESKDCEGHEDTAPEENESKSRFGFLVGLDGLSRGN
mmetsp:Transcript_20873/g.43902  ORF Transcript_20873/g.43902 Transcript_20873/m.43902 type:complete len:167 (-) Transcript_20873:435-935(-)